MITLFHAFIFSLAVDYGQTNYIVHSKNFSEINPIIKKIGPQTYFGGIALGAYALNKSNWKYKKPAFIFGTIIELGFITTNKQLKIGFNF